MNRNENTFEEQLRQKMESYAEPPPPEVWEAVCRQVPVAPPPPGSTSSRYVFFLLVAGLLAVVLSLLFFSSPQRAQPELPTSPGTDTIPRAEYERGRTLFQNYCNTCHSMDLVSDLTGPALFGITERRSLEWLFRFTRNSQQMIREGDPIALAVWEEWEPTIMPAFYSIPEEDLRALYGYIEQRSNEIRKSRTTDE